MREAVLQGLIGGGMEVGVATKLMQSNFDDLPIQQFVPIAQAVVMAALFGPEDEPLGEPGAGKDPSQTSPAASYGSQAFMDPERRSASTRAKSTTSPSGS